MGFNCSGAIDFPSAKLVGYICNGGMYDKNGPFAESLYYVLVTLRNETPNQGYDYYVTSPYPNDALAYGHATCKSNIASSDDCAICVSLARSYLMTTCDGRIGGQVEFAGCSMRYEQYPFS